MAIASRTQFSAAYTCFVPGNLPSVVPLGAAIDGDDQYQAFWSFPATPGGLLFFGTVLSDVQNDSYGGITFDENGNLRVSGTVYP